MTKPPANEDLSDELAPAPGANHLANIANQPHATRNHPNFTDSVSVDSEAVVVSLATCLTCGSCVAVSDPGAVDLHLRWHDSYPADPSQVPSTDAIKRADVRETVADGRKIVE